MGNRRIERPRTLLECFRKRVGSSILAGEYSSQSTTGRTHSTVGHRYNPALIGFRWLSQDDLPLLHQWLNEGAAFAWYGLEPTTLAEVVLAYTPRLRGQSSVLAMLITYEDKPVGYIQRYYPRDEADYWGRQELPANTAGIDLFIGEADFLHHGFGPLAIHAFLRKHVFIASTSHCIIDPDPDNAIAIRAYEKVGFRHIRTIGPPEHVERAYLMMLDRTDYEAMSNEQ
jgi:RimJ/RimL family protein N-acetyltransferase